VPPELAWVAIILGLAVVGLCFLMPREIGHEHEPIVDVRLDMPSMEALSARLQSAGSKFRSQAVGRPQPAVEPETAASASAAARTEAQTPPPQQGETPSPMGAPQPVITQDPLPAFALPLERP